MADVRDTPGRNDDEIRGMNIFGVKNDQFVWDRIYTELVREVGGLEGQVWLNPHTARAERE